jgi:hypothetical protein
MNALVRGDQFEMGKVLRDLGEELDWNLETLSDRSGADIARFSWTRQILQREQGVVGVLREPKHGRQLRPVKSMLARHHLRRELDWLLRNPIRAVRKLCRLLSFDSELLCEFPLGA